MENRNIGSRLSEGLSPKEIQKLAVLKKELSGNVSLYLIRDHVAAICYFVVAVDGVQAYDILHNEHISFDKEKTDIRNIQRNVDLQKGLFMTMGWKTHTGERHARMFNTRNLRKRQKRRERRAEKRALVAQAATNNYEVFAGDVIHHTILDAKIDCRFEPPDLYKTVENMMNITSDLHYSDIEGKLKSNEN